MQPDGYKNLDIIKVIFSVRLPERFIQNVCCTFGPRFIRVSPESRSIYSCTVIPAPESVTPSVDCRHFPANFISKYLILHNQQNELWCCWYNYNVQEMILQGCFCEFITIYQKIQKKERNILEHLIKRPKY